MLELVKLGLAFVLPVLYLFYRHYSRPLPIAVPAEDNQKPLKTIMQAPKTDLAPPKDDPFTTEQLKQYDGTDPSKPILVAIKGTIFDVTAKAEVYGPGKSYNIFAGRMGRETLDEKDMKVLDDWHAFFSKRYNIVGKVSDGPSSNM